MNESLSPGRRLLVLGLYLVALLSGMIALACFYAYGREVLNSIGSNDKSLLFWYLPILFIGIFASQGAFICAMLARRKRRGE